MPRRPRGLDGKAALPNGVYWGSGRPAEEGVVFSVVVIPVESEEARKGMNVVV